MSVTDTIGDRSGSNLPVEFTANKLKSGAGEAVLFVLDVLADAALIHNNFKWEKMVPPEREDDDIAVDQDEENDSVSEVEEDDYIDDDDGVYVDLSAPLHNEPENNQIQAILHSNTDVQAWREEVERVTPFLKIVVRQDAKNNQIQAILHSNTDVQAWREEVERVTPFLKIVVRQDAKY
ncbi:hypothetical protein DICVIV_00444 [Dictyocaulus viviparus]|uniref:Uncharacterized protein n=1 Tax=Dictyocaulus viviparus TaxID=29172 RepID=A0A0D8YFA1_DICVI|nr:hypothetical protein DICVIV_00444 [Dictyocaulus viviparus]